MREKKYELHPLGKGTHVYVFMGVGLVKCRVRNLRDKESFLYDLTPLKVKRITDEGAQSTRGKKAKAAIIQIRLHPEMQRTCPTQVRSYTAWGLARDFDGRLDKIKQT